MGLIDLWKKETNKYNLWVAFCLFFYMTNHSGDAAYMRRDDSDQQGLQEEKAGKTKGAVFVYVWPKGRNIMLYATSYVTGKWN